MHRKLWQDIARDYGFEVEDKPRAKKMQRKETALYKEEQIRRQDDVLEKLSSEIEVKKAEKEAVISVLSDYISQLKGRRINQMLKKCTCVIMSLVMTFSLCAVISLLQTPTMILEPE